MNTTDHWIAGPQGRLFARSWTPEMLGADTWPTVILFHESLGCVEVWRDFAERLAVVTGLPVVAYDRLGFGRSDPYPGTLPLDFMRAKAADTMPVLTAQLGLRALIPFGHSAGRAMAVATAAHNPDRCVTFITMGAQAFVEERALAGIRRGRGALRDPDQLARTTRSLPRFAVRCWPCTATGMSTARAFPKRIGQGGGGPSEVVVIEACGHVPRRDQPQPSCWRRHVSSPRTARTHLR